MKRTLIFVLVFISVTLLAQNYELQFNGNDFVQVSNSPSLNPGAITVEFWVKPMSLDDIPNFVSKGGNYGGYTPQYMIYHSQTNNCLRYISGNTGQQPNLNSNNPLSVGIWQHVALTHSGSTIRFYVNGIPDGHTTTGGQLANPTTQLLHFGVEARKQSTMYLNGSLDEIRIWNTALDQATIQEWMNQPINASHPNYGNLAGYWKLNEGSGQLVLDASGNGNDGQLGSTGTGDTNDPSWGLSDNPLPIELTSFQAIQTTAGFAQINWTTQSESNLWGYNIYRSQDNELETSFMLNPTIIAAENSPTGFEYAYTDKEVETENTYYYWLESVDLSGNTEFFGPTQITIETEQLPEPITETNLMANYPNPFNPTTTIKFNIKENETGILTIYNTKGQLLESHQFSSGNHNYVWQADEYTSGVYFYKLQTDSYSKIKKMILMK